MVLGMLGLGYVASHARKEDSVILSAAQIVTKEPAEKDRELGALQADQEDGTSQQLATASKGEEPEEGSKDDSGLNEEAVDDLERQEDALLQDSPAGSGKAQEYQSTFLFINPQVLAIDCLFCWIFPPPRHAASKSRGLN